MVWRVSGGAILIGRSFRPVGFRRYVPLSGVQLAFLTVIRQRLYLFGDPGMVGFPAVEKCDQWSRVDNDRRVKAKILRLFQIGAQGPSPLKSTTPQ
jgi:hypothetical protein